MLEFCHMISFVTLNFTSDTQKYCNYANTSLASLPRSCMHVVSWHWSVAQIFFDYLANKWIDIKYHIPTSVFKQICIENSLL